MNINLIKLLIILFIVLLFVVPLLLMFVFKKGTYKTPNNKKNIIFLIMAILELIAFCILINLIHKLGDFILNIPIVGNIIKSVFGDTGEKTEYFTFVVIALVVNLIALYAYLIFKNFFLRRVNKVNNKQNEENNEEENENEETKEEEVKTKRRKLAEFLKNKKEDIDHKVIVDEFGDEERVERPLAGIKKKILGVFFEEPEFIHIKPWVLRCVKVLQGFIYIFVSLYFVLLLLLIVSIFYKMPDGMYKFLINILRIDKWYIYPFVSLIILQELCNFFKSTVSKFNFESIDSEQIKQLEIEAKLGELQLLIKQRFDKEHYLRFYPSIDPKEVPDYVTTNVAYAPALDFIRNQMKLTSGHTVQSYLECLDAMYNSNHVYFCASFYSEFGEYLIAYTYTRLLAGERVIFIIPQQKERENFKKYIRLRLNRLTRSSEEYSWRVYTSDERLDQADVLITSPEEFKTDAIVVNNPIFFEEVCNAIFIDVDKMVMLESYLCPIISMRLQRATNNRIKFVFTTNSIYRGFAAGSLPKFFCIDKVLNFSGAKENESVTYNVWNRESKSNRIYNKHGQTLISPECIIAELALSHDIDGVRVITDAAIEHSDKESLIKHNVEINNLYKEIPDINYLIYTDEICNLSAAVYLCARFRGKKQSIIHILTKPYMLREYFLSKMQNEDFVNRSSFIQPRVIEHADNQKLSLLKVYCEATCEEGIEVNAFVNRMRDVITLSLKRGDNSLCEFCQKILEKYEYKIGKIGLKDLTSYLIAGLCDSIDTPVYNSLGEKVKDYYIIVDSTISDGFNIVKTKNVVFKRTKEVFEKILASNDKVALVLNDKRIGFLNTFSTRVKSEYIIGQNITFNNVEYEIEQISDDYRTIFLKRENVKYKNTLDTMLLRRFKNIELIEQIGLPGELYNSQSNLEYIRIRLYKANLLAETYGFYNLMSDNQSLNFIEGVQGNPLLNKEIVSNMSRNIRSGKVLELELISRIEVNDEIRLLLSAVINEFIKTLFPYAYRCVAICPILEKPYDIPDDSIPETYEDYVSRLYPYIINNNENEYLKETDKKKLRFLFINDAENEDVGVLDWFFDLQGHLMQELLINVYSYLAWLKLRPEEKHYIYFGNNSLAKCFDLEGCCELLKGLNLLLSDAGADDFETASDENDEIVERCSFCHKIVESGRFTTFNKTRFICADCFEVASSQEILEKLHAEIFEYLTTEYADEKFRNLNIALDNHYTLEKGKELTEYYYKFDHSNHLVKVERDIPIVNAKVALLRATISSWQADNDLLISYIDGQLYYEELKYLRSIGEESSAKWIYENIDEQIRNIVDEIKEFVSNDDSIESEESNDNIALTSFDFIRMKAKELDEEEYEKNIDELIEFDDDHIGLYNPNIIPRLWKRYLRMTAKEIEEEENDEEIIDVIPEDPTEPEELQVEGDNMVKPIVKDNCPNPLNEDQNVESISNENPDEEMPTNPTSNENPTSEKEDELKLKKEEEKKKKEEAKLKKEEELKLKKEEEKKKKEEEKIKKEEERKKKEEEKKRQKQDKKTEQEERRKQKQEARLKKKEEKKKRREEKINENSDPEEEIIKKKKPKKTITFGEKMIPFEDDEDSNKKLKLYNTIARAAYNLSNEKITYAPLTRADLDSIYRCVIHDYPELFWVSTYTYTDTQMWLNYRCLKSNGTIDKNQINKKRKELRNAAKPFIKGITKKTDPYQAFLTIYRRLILTIDYDGIGLDSDSAGSDTDDNLRSLYSALVSHKVVCAGYAVALQYLLNLVGIPACYVGSEPDANGSTHAFNIVKIGKSCYYVDATWGDASNTKSGDYAKNKIYYEYCCTPFNEFKLTIPSSVPNHTPKHTNYPNMKPFENVTYEYYRYHKAYFTRCDEQQLINWIVSFTKNYDPKEMGDFSISLRASTDQLAKTIQKYVYDNRIRIVQEVHKKLKEIKQDKKLIYVKSIENVYAYNYTRVVEISFSAPQLDNSSKKSIFKNKK